MIRAKPDIKRQIIIFTRYPEPGKVKTRLIERLGAAGAAELHAQMTKHTLSCVRELNKDLPVSLEVCYAGGDALLMREWLGDGLAYNQQSGGDLGERLEQAFRTGFQAGASYVIIIGTDCPDLTPQLLTKAFVALQDHDLVIGPAKDGGYYLIGLKRPIPQLFQDLPWGTEEVCQKTLAISQQLGLCAFILESLSDVDRPDDLYIWEKYARYSFARSSSPYISVIIPTLNESAHITKTLAAISATDNVEILVADGGSVDQTAQLALEFGVKVLNCSTGRAKQMNKGAQEAKGEILLFLHADTLLPAGFCDIIQQIMFLPQVAAGAFSLRLDSTRWGLRIIEWLANWRSRLWQAPYGDQAIFVKAKLFHELGGFPDLPIMEDVEIIWRLRKRGCVIISPALVLTSTRRWDRLGIWKTTWLNQLAISAYLLGCSPSRLASWYYNRD